MLVNARHQKKTEANCIIVSVAGFGKALRIDLEEVFVSAEVIYHTMQNACSESVTVFLRMSRSLLLTISLYETGALSASANSCAFSLTLPCLVRILCSASLTLLLCRCVCTPPGRASRNLWLIFLEGHRSSPFEPDPGVISWGLSATKEGLN